MNWFDKVRNAVARVLPGGGRGEARYGPVFRQWARDRQLSLSSDPSGIKVDPRSALTLAAYFAAINVLSTDLACIPKKVYRKRKSGGRDEVTDDPRLAILNVSPDGETTGMRFLQALYGHMLGWGNGYAEIDLSGGVVVGLSLLEPTTKAERRSQDNRLYYRLPDSSTRPPYRVLHFAGLGFDGLSGYSVAETARRTLSLGINAETFGSAFFGNGAHPGGYFVSPIRMEGDSITRFRESVNALHQGASNAFKFMVLEQGMEFKSATIPAKDAEFLATRQFQVIEVARLFRLPPNKLGDYSQAHYANIESSNLDYAMTTLMPHCVASEQMMNLRLLTAEERSKGFYIRHNMDVFLRGDAESRIKLYEGLFGMGVIGPNDIAEREDLNPIGPVGDERFLTVQAQPMSIVLNPPAPELGSVPAPKSRISSNGANGDGR